MAAHEASQTPSRQPQTPPAPLTPAWLRAHFDPLPFPARMSALARYARTLTPHAYATLHRALDTGDPEERHTGLFLARVRRDLDRLAEALDDPLLGRRARSAALRLPVPDEPLERLVLSDIRATRHDTYRLLRLSHRHALAARMLPRVHERHGAREAGALLPACPAETVTAWLPRVQPTAGTLNSLARTAPRALAAHLAEQFARQPPRESYRFVRRYRAVASVAARRDPDAALLLLERAPGLLTPHGVLAALHRPAEALAVLRAADTGTDGDRPERPIPGGPLPPALRRVLRTLPAGGLVELAEYCPSGGRPASDPGRYEVAPDGLLLLVPPAGRRRIIEGRRVARGRLRGSPPATLAALEPADRRELLSPWLDRYGRSPWTAARLTAALPLADGEPRLRALADHHRLHHRAFAWPALLACAELEGDAGQFARIALDCERAWHDRDEVRRAALQQLAGATPRLLAALPERVLRDAVLTAVQSRDSTPGTLSAARRLLRRVVERAAATGDGQRAAVAVELLGELASASGRTVTLTVLNVDETAARALWTAVRAPALRRPAVATALAELLAPHLTALPELDTEVRRIALESDDPQLATRAAAAWVRPPDVREQRCAELLAQDATFATVPVILRTVATRLTHLLGPVLTAAQGQFTGRLRARATPWTPQLRPGTTGRWLGAQRDAWNEHHARVALDETAPLRARTDAAKLLRDPARLATLAREAPQPVAAAALAALGETAAWQAGHPVSQPDGEAPTDLLLRHTATGGVRGRAAVAALRRLLGRLPDEDALALLSPVACAAGTPVGARKEAVRAVAALPGEDAMRTLIAAWDVPGGHLDVRAVLAGALLRAVDRPAVADRLLGAVREPVVLDAVVHTRTRARTDVPRGAYTAFLVRLIEEGDDDAAHAACQALPTWMGPGADDAARTLADVAVAPDRSRTVWESAARQLLQLPPGHSTERVVQAAFDALAERARAEDARVRIDALRRLHACAGAARPVIRGDSELPVLDLLAQTLEAVGLNADAAELSWQAALDAVRHGRFDASRWERLARLCEAGPGRLPSEHDVWVDLGRPRARAAALAAVRTLRARATPASGLLALTLTRSGGGSSEWEAPWRTELEALSAHEDPDTALGALLTEPD